MPDTIPNTWDYKKQITAAKKVLVFEPYSGPRQTRTFGDGTPIHSWEIGNEDSDRADFIAIKQFWDDHYPGIPFYLYDPQVDEYRTFEIDSDFAQTYAQGESYSWGFRIKEVFPYLAVVGTPP
jgi:hypothetical protein